MHFFKFAGLPSLLASHRSSPLSGIYDSLATGGLSADVSLEQPSPQYVLAHSGNVTAILGKGAILNCRVQGVANRTVSANISFVRFEEMYDPSIFQVSWMRHKDTHLLTAGRLV